jgi:hypothetical protein
MAHRTLLPGYTRLTGSSKRVLTPSGSVISDRAYHAISGAKTTAGQSKTDAFEAILARTNNLERAKHESGVSGRQLENYRRQFAQDGRGSASPFEKIGNRWQFRGAQGYEHTFVNPQGKAESATFSGRNLIAIQNYRTAVSERSQAELDQWLKAHPAGIPDDSGRMHIPETDLRRIDAANKRMTKRQRAQFQKKQFYATAA